MLVESVVILRDKRRWLGINRPRAPRTCDATRSDATEVVVGGVVDGVSEVYAG
jgi:hypothetical protein